MRLAVVAALFNRNLITLPVRDTKCVFIQSCGTKVGFNLQLQY